MLFSSNEIPIKELEKLLESMRRIRRKPIRRRQEVAASLKVLDTKIDSLKKDLI